MRAQLGFDIPHRAIAQRGDIKLYQVACCCDVDVTQGQFRGVRCFEFEIRDNGLLGSLDNHLYARRFATKIL